jgi:F-type H+-transporting ATPase subunit b
MSDILEQLDINQTFFLQFALFAIFFFVLSAIYLKPFQKIIQQRNQRLKNDAEGATELLRTVEAKLQEYEKSLAQIRIEAKTQYDLALTDARTQEDAALHQHKEELKKEYLKVLEQFQDEKLKIESELKNQMATMTDSITQKVLSGK